MVPDLFRYLVRRNVSSPSLLPEHDLFAGSDIGRSVTSTSIQSMQTLPSTRHRLPLTRPRPDWTAPSGNRRRNRPAHRQPSWPVRSRRSCRSSGRPGREQAAPRPRWNVHSHDGTQVQPLCSGDIGVRAVQHDARSHHVEVGLRIVADGAAVRHVDEFRLNPVSRKRSKPLRKASTASNP